MNVNDSGEMEWKSSSKFCEYITAITSITNCILDFDQPKPATRVDVRHENLN